MGVWNRGFGFFIVFAILVVVLEMLTGTQPTNLTWYIGLVFSTWYALEGLKEKK